MTELEKPEIIVLEVPADIKYLDAISSVFNTVLDRLDQPPESSNAQFSIVLAVHEACTNIIEHAYHGMPGQIRIRIEINHGARSMVIDLQDDGDEAESTNITEREPGAPQIKGYGLYIIRQLVDLVEYSREGEINRWRLTKYL